MLNFHRGIGQTVLLDQADKQGLLYYEEPGGYQAGMSGFALAFKREKLIRMIRRDRNHPSLIIYNMINEAAREPFPFELEDIKEAHRADETRLITFTATHFTRQFYNGECPTEAAPFKMHMLPYNDSIYYDGIWDEHHAGGPGVYLDELYNGPGNIHRHYPHTSEIVFLGEEGAIGTPDRLQLIHEEIMENGDPGWDGDRYLAQYEAFDHFLDTKGFRVAFPSVDMLTRSLGEVSHYYQGRIIENFRIGNTGDGFVINGWESCKVDNHSGIVDIYRNPKAETEILAHYNQPLYIAVKMRNKVVPLGDSIITDFFLVNEGYLKGKYFLRITVQDNTGMLDESGCNLEVEGGNTYGELLREGMAVQTKSGGYLTIKAQLYDGDRLLAEGEDQAFAVDYDPGSFQGSLAVVDTSGEMQNLLTGLGITGFTSLDKQFNDPEENILLMGGEIPPGLNILFRLNDPILDWISRGNTLVIVKNAGRWAEYLDLKEVVEYRGSKRMEPVWVGGNYFVREHALFEGLPVNAAFNWEYQSLTGYENRIRFGMRLNGEEAVVGCYADHNKELYTAVGIIRHGRGHIILSALDLSAAISENKKSGVVARQILLNYLKYGQ